MKISFRQIIQVALISSGWLLTLPVQAAQPSETSVEKLADVMHLEGTFNQLMKNGLNPQVIQKIVADNLKMSPKHKSITPQQRQQLGKFFKTFQTELFSAINTPELRAQLKRQFIEAAQQFYTQKEVDAMLAFYDNPVGQSILKKQPQLMKAYSDKIIPFMIEKQQAFMREKLPQFKEEIKKILDTSTDK